jgi:hypothetical protein
MPAVLKPLVYTYIMQLVWRFTVAFYGGATLSFRPSDFGAEPWRSFSDDTAERLPACIILERSRGGAPATILRSDCPALLFGAEPWRSSSGDTAERLRCRTHC